MAQSPKSLVPRFFGNTAKTYERVANFATYGKDNSWKKEIVRKIDNVNSILDLACGTGKLTRMLASKFPNSKIVGLDISKGYLDMAKEKFFPNISFVHQDAENMNLGEKFDCICSSYIPKYCNPKLLVRTCLNHLNPNGSIIFHDFVYPKNNLVKGLWKFHFVLLRLLGNFIPSWKYAFCELPRLIKTSEWVDQYKQELEKNGFTVRQKNLTLNTSVILYSKRNT